MIPKFRIFDKDTKEWQSIRSIGLEEDGSILYIQCWDKYEVDIDPPYFMDNLGIDFELMQSAGLHDVNGKEIFEGDIVKINTLPEIGVVKFDETHCRFTINLEILMSVPIFKELAEQDVKIIGNVHEHSHLLDNGGHRE